MRIDVGYMHIFSKFQLDCTNETEVIEDEIRKMKYVKKKYANQLKIPFFSTLMSFYTALHVAFCK